MERERDRFAKIIDSFRSVTSNEPLKKRGVKSKPEYFSELISKMRRHWKDYKRMKKEKRKKMVKGAVKNNKTKQKVNDRNKLRNLISAAENRAREKLKSMHQDATKIKLKKKINLIIKLLAQRLSPEETSKVQR